MENKRAILLLSGGIDSATLLAKLSSENYDVIAIRQKHEIELNYVKKNAEKYGVKKHHIIELDKSLFNSSALVNNESRECGVCLSYLTKQKALENA